MLNRQKVLLELLRTADRSVGKIELVKWCFLLRQETPSAGGSAFYDFLPYHYGPYSFGLQRELSNLNDLRYVREEAGQWVRTELRVGGTSPPKQVMNDSHRLVAQLVTLPKNSCLITFMSGIRNSR